MHHNNQRTGPAFKLAEKGMFTAATARALCALREQWIQSLDESVLDEIIRWNNEAGDIKGLREEVLPALITALPALRGADEREARASALYWFAQQILDHGDLALALDLLRLAVRLSQNPMFLHTVGMLESYEQLKDEAERCALLHLCPERPAYVISSVVWGDIYVDNYMNYMIRSLLAPGNLPALRNRDMHLSIVTTPSGRDRMRRHPRYADISEYARVHFFTFPEALIQVGNQTDPGYAYYQLYGVMDHVSIAFAKALKAGILLLPVDCIVAVGSLRNMLARIEEGYDVVGMTNIVAKREQFLPKLDATFGTGTVLAATARQLANLALTCLHQESFGNLVAPENQDFSLWARDMFWPTEGGIHSRCVFVHPLCVSADCIGRNFTIHYKWVDLYLSDALFPRVEDFHKFYLVPNSEEAYITNFATENRRFPGSDKPFHPLTFAEGNKHAPALNRWFLTQPQFIACDTEMRTRRDPDADVAEVLEHMAELRPLPSARAA
jgi:hypothetical protein